MPNNFCISYEHARKNDIDENGKDHKCHKNDEQLQDSTLDLDEESLRKLFSSVNLAKENGLRPWETKYQDKQNADLSISSGKIIAEDGEER